MGLSGGGDIGGARFTVEGVADFSQVRNEISKTAKELETLTGRFRGGVLLGDTILAPGSGEKAAKEVGKTTSAVDKLAAQIARFNETGEIRFITPKSVLAAEARLKQIERHITDFQKRRVSLVPSGDAERELKGLRLQQNLLQNFIGEARSQQARLTNFEQAELKKRQQAYMSYYANIQNLFVRGAQAQRKAQEALGASLTGSINRAAPSFAKQRQKEFDQLIASSSGLEKQTGKLSSAFANLGKQGGTVGKLATGLSSLFARAEQKLDSFGLSVSDVSILLGAGFAGGVAGAVQVGLKLVQVLARMGEAVVKFLFDAAQLGATVITFRDRIDAAFGDSGQRIREFSTGVAESLGLSERAALKHIGSIGNLFKSFEVGEAAAAEFGIGLVRAAEVIQKTSFTTDTYEEVLQKLRGSLTGNIEALREYGIAVNETTLRDTAAAHGLEVLGGELNAASKALLAQIFIYDQVTARQDEFADSLDSQLSAQDRLSASVENLKTDLGEDLAPILLEITEAVTSFVNKVGEGLDSLEKFAQENDRAIDIVGSLAKSFAAFNTGPFANVLALVAETIRQVENLLNLADKIPGIDFGPKKEDVEQARKLGDTLGFVVEESQSFSDRLKDLVTGNPFDKLRRAAEGFGEAFAGTGEDAGGLDNFVSKTEKFIEQLGEGEINATEFFNILSGLTDLTPDELQIAFKENFDELVKLVPALEKYRDQLVGVAFDTAKLEEEFRREQERIRKTPEFLQKLVDAYKNLEDALEDTAKAERDAQKALADAQEDGIKRVAEARKNLAKAEEEGRERVSDAEERLRETREDEAERVRDAEERLREQRLDAKEQVSNAEEKLAKTRVDNAKRIQGAEKKLHDARLSQQRQLLDARLALEDALMGGDARAINAARLASRRAKESEQVQEAERALIEARQEAVENLQEAEKSLEEARIDAAKKVAKAERNLTEAREEAAERIEDAEEALADAVVEAQERIQEATERLTEAREESAERIKEAEERLFEVQERNIELIQDAREKVLELEGGFVDATTRVQELNRELERMRALLGSNLFGGFPQIPITGFQHGGSPRAGTFGIVGEAGPEAVMFGQNARVFSNKDLLRALRGLQGGSTNITINEVSGDSRATVRLLLRELGRHSN